MSAHSIAIATKGIIAPNPATKGFAVLNIEEIAFADIGGVGGPGGGFLSKIDETKEKVIKIKYIYNDVIYEEVRAVGKQINIDVKDIDIEIVDNVPKIKLRIL